MSRDHSCRYNHRYVQVDALLFRWRTCLHAWSGWMGNLPIHFYAYNNEHVYMLLFTWSSIRPKAPFTLVHFRFKTHNFCYGYAYSLHYSSVFEVKNGDFRKRCRPRFRLKTPGLRFSVNGPKRRLLKMMPWLPTFALRILDDRVNNNIMLIVVPIDMYR